MLIQTLLNKCHPLNQFVYKSIRFERVNGKESIIVDVVARKNSRTICSTCERARGN